MKRRAVAPVFLLVMTSLYLSPLKASDILYDSVINVNGSVTEGSFSIAGLNSSGFNTATGQGTLIFTFSPGAVGSYFFDIWLDNDLSAPNFNEYGATSGTAAAGQSWQIGDPTPYYNSGLPPGGLGPGVDIVDNTALNVLSNANGLPGNTDNFLGNCAGGTCNGDASMAMGFAFTLAANQEEVITLNVSQNVPTSGFYLQQIHPVDGCDSQGMNCANPTQLNLYFSGSAVAEGTGGQTPEPGTWLLVSSAAAVLLLFRSRKLCMPRLKLARVRSGAPLLIVLTLLALPQLAQSQAITVLTVPWDPTGPAGATPHTTYNLCSDGSTPNYTVKPPTCTLPATLTESTITLGATAILPNTTDTYTGVWNFGDGSPNVTVPVSGASLNNYNLATTHQYPASAPAGTVWDAVLTVTDTDTSVQGNATYSVIQEGDTTQSGQNGGLSGRLSAIVNVAIDTGLWFSHVNMWRGTTTVSGNTVNWGGWDSYGGCFSGYICGPYGGLDANFLEAFEVNGHQANGPASDPYTDDVARGLARMFYFLIPYSPTVNGTKEITYNPATLVDRCSDGTVPNFSNNPPTCSTGTLIQYNPNATSCTSPPCMEIFDHNANGQILYPGNDNGQPGYEVGMYVGALVASNNPGGVANYGSTGSAGLPGVYNQTYLNIVTDLMDGIEYCQYYADPYDGTVQSGYDAGGGWQYYCAATSSPNYDDNSVSQWNAIGLIEGFRGFNIPIPKVVLDTNQVWVTYSQDVNASEPCLIEGNSSWNCTGIANNNSVVGAFGYGGDFAYGFEPWGPFAVTPSGMVQMALDGIGRTAAGNPDQRWNLAESFYHDNFCYNYNTPSQQNNYTDPLFYTYGMLSFSKAMSLHDPGFGLSPIQFLEDQPAGTNPIDWYGALSPAHGGTSPCDGFAETLVERQASDGHWGNLNSQYDQNSTQSLFETAWALLILKQTFIVPCIDNLNAKGKPATPESPATVTLTWSHQQGASGYKVLRSTTPGGTAVAVGTTTSTVFVDTGTGLKNGSTYYYFVQPLNSGTEICQSNQATVTVPRYH